MRTMLSCLLILPGLASAEDWPHWRGPRRDGISAEKDWMDRWPKEGPMVAWKASVGTGFSTVSVSNGRLYTMGNEDNRDIVVCLDALTGAKLWSHSYEADVDANLFEGGPTATPTVAGNRVYTLSRQGDAFCFDAAGGKVVWSVNLKKETGARVPTWGFSGSVLVQDGVAFLNVCEAGVALDAATGKRVWSSGDGESGYSTPLPFSHKGEPHAIFSSADAYVAVALKTGKELWRISWPTRYGVNAADPVLAGGRLLVSSGYGKGSALVKLEDGAPAAIWENRDLRNQINSTVLLDGFLYGIDGDVGSRPALRCLELATGDAKWSEEEIGSGALTAADGKLIVLSARGELMIAPASPSEFKPVARAKVLEGKCWTVPVLANGRIYCRNAAGDLVCLDVRKK